MANALRSSIVMALLVLACVAGPAAAELATPPSGILGLASRVLSHLPESGALLLWGTGLAAASRAVSRKRNDPHK